MPIALFDAWRATGREVAVVGLGQERRGGDPAAPRTRGFRSMPPTPARGRPTRPGLPSSGTLGPTVQLGGHDLDRIARAAARRGGARRSPGRPRRSRRRGAAGRRRSTPRWTSGSSRSARPAASGSRAPTARPPRRRSSPTCWPPAGFAPRRRATSAAPSATWRWPTIRRTGWRSSFSSFQLHDAPQPASGRRRAHQPGAQPPRSVSPARGLLRGQGAAVPQRRVELRLGQQRRRRRRADDGRPGAGNAPPLLDREPCGWLVRSRPSVG